MDFYFSFRKTDHHILLISIRIIFTTGFMLFCFHSVDYFWSVTFVDYQNGWMMVFKWWNKNVNFSRNSHEIQWNANITEIKHEFCAQSMPFHQTQIHDHNITSELFGFSMIWIFMKPIDASNLRQITIDLCLALFMFYEDASKNTLIVDTVLAKVSSKSDFKTKVFVATSTILTTT